MSNIKGGKNPFANIHQTTREATQHHHEGKNCETKVKKSESFQNNLQ
jgi:hypothetical protein